MATLDDWVNAFISDSFRDIADQDYIAARIAFRHDLTEPFLWLALQAVEKYLKAILLFHRIDTRNLRHRVEAALDLVVAKTDLTFPPDIHRFVSYIGEEGTNRYLQRHSNLHEDALVGLDRSVWHLRRYCYPIQSAPKWFTDQVQALGDDPLEYRIRFSIPGGYLEKVLSQRNDKRRQLVWKNFWFGARRKRRIRTFPQRIAWKQPIIYSRPDVYEALKALVLFDPVVKDHFERRS